MGVLIYSIRLIHELFNIGFILEQLKLSMNIRVIIGHRLVHVHVIVIVIVIIVKLLIAAVMRVRVL